MIEGHIVDNLTAQQADAIKFTTIQQHTAKTEVIRSGRTSSAAAGEKGAGLLDILLVAGASAT